MAVHSSSLRHHIWRAAMKIAPLPVLARPRDSAYWQRHWREKQPAEEFGGYAISTDLKKWFARQVVDLKPRTVLELGCNVGANLREIAALDPSVKLYGIELNERAIEWSAKNGVAPKDATIMCGSMADAKSLMQQNGANEVDIVFTSAAAMHCDDDIFALTKDAALTLARRAIMHLEFNAWTPADLQNWRSWRNSFASDRWIRDYTAEYQDCGAAEIKAIAIPHDVNHTGSIGRMKVNDVTGLVVVKLK